MSGEARVRGITNAPKPRMGQTSVLGVRIELVDSDEARTAATAARVAINGRGASGWCVPEDPSRPWIVTIRRPVSASSAGGALVDDLRARQEICHRAASEAVKKHRDPTWRSPREIKAEEVEAKKASGARRAEIVGLVEAWLDDVQDANLDAAEDAVRSFIEPRSSGSTLSDTLRLSEAGAE